MEKMSASLIAKGYGPGEARGLVAAGITSGPMANMNWKKPE